VRLAVVSPLPPAPTGIADYTAELVALLAESHAIDVFHAQAAVDRSRLPDGCGVFAASELQERHSARPYDAVLHQLGNSPEHAFQHELVAKVPGVLVLHDLVLFHSRAAAFLDATPVRAWRAAPGSRAARDAARPALAAWRDELEQAWPGRGTRAFEAHLRTTSRLLAYACPLFRAPVAASRAVVVHNACMARAVREECPGTPVAVVPHPARREAVDAFEVAALRARLGFAERDLVVGSFGLVTREKRIETIARAVSRASGLLPGLRLLVAGPLAERATLEARLAALGLHGRAVVTGRVPLAELAAHLEAADLVAHLRWPTGRETSGALLRVLAQGRPAIVSDLENQAELPDDVVRRVDPADEEEGFLNALLDLATRADERERLGRAAAAFTLGTHGSGAVRAAWRDVLAGL
jgi:glycosyltransferase involved in cell wall biosynthesis